MINLVVANFKSLGVFIIMSAVLLYHISPISFLYLLAVASRIVKYDQTLFLASCIEILNLIISVLLFLCATLVLQQ